MRKLPTFLLLLIAPFFTFTQNQPPVAVNDTASTLRGYIKLDVLDNDYDVDSDSFRILTVSLPKHGIASKINDSVIEYKSMPSFAFGVDSLSYRIRQYNAGLNPTTSLAWVILNVDNSLTYDSVDINNINAGFNANGDLFWTHTDPFNHYVGYYNQFEVPKGSGKRTMFNGNLWIGGKDQIDTIHVAAQRYNDPGRDYWAGPVSNVYDSLYDLKWKRIWKIKKTDIDYHLTHCWQSGYVPSFVLAEWPGNGDTTLGQQNITAPFKDWNNDGIYDPSAGDYPIIKGNEAVYFIFNDDRYLHTESNADKLKIEVHGMAYSFDCPDDSALWNTIFLNYKIYNRSSMTYDSTYVGTRIDTDIGFFYDDFIGCDVQRGTFYGYNGVNNDGSGQATAYGAHPPAQGIVFLAGPKLDDDGMDNPAGLCDEGLNGVNFGNNVIDDERYGLTSFIGNIFIPGPWYPIDPPPLTGRFFYNQLKGEFPDGYHMFYGGYGTSTTGYGPDCVFMLPGLSDTCNWGTGGIPPNGSVNWTEITAGTYPNDRNGVCSSGPFTFKPGDMQELDIAFVFGRDYIDTNATAALPVLMQRIDSIRKYFINDTTPCGGGFSGIINCNKQMQFKLYPNPAFDNITIETINFSKEEISIYNIQGQLLFSQAMKSEKEIIDISSMSKGMYFLKLEGKDGVAVRKFVKE